MSFFANANINRLSIHSALYQLAYTSSALFAGAFLLHLGLSATAVFVVAGAILVLRLILRPIVPVLVRIIGLKRTLILGTLLSAVRYPALAFVHGNGTALVVFCALAASGTVLYWPCFHAYFAALGDIERRGSQVGIRQILSAGASVLGPALGGAMLGSFGPWAAFAMAAAITLLSIVPIQDLADAHVATVAPPATYSAAKIGVMLFATDGFYVNASVWAWLIIIFLAVEEHFTAFGAVLAAVALAGAISGVVLGRLIDLGHARRIIWINAALVCSAIIARTVCGMDQIIVVVVAIGSTMLSGLYYLPLMTAVYNQAKLSPCPFRFHIAAEGGWDIGGVLSCLIAVAIVEAGAPLQAVIILALPAIVVQTCLLDYSYATLEREKLSILPNPRSN
jgi:DHA1 family inner membrane transport protein